MSSTALASDELSPDGGAVRVHDVGEAPQPLEVVVEVGAGLLRGRAAARVDPDRAHQQQAGATGGRRAWWFRELAVGDRAAGLGEIVAHRAHDHAVPQGQRADRGRRREQRKRGGSGHRRSVASRRSCARFEPAGRSGQAT